MFRSIITKVGPLERGELIYRQSTPFNSLFLVRSGAVKIETISESGRPSVIEFFLAGDLFGVDAIGSATYPNDAVALETTWLCQISYKGWLALCARLPSLQHRLILLLGMGLQYVQYSGKVIRNESAGSRILHFLHTLSRRQTGRADVGTRVQLTMSKQDAASYLGLTPESFSRTLTRLHNDGYIRKESARVMVLMKPCSIESYQPRNAIGGEGSYVARPNRICG